MAKLALNGGDKLRNEPFPRWPVYGEEEEKALIEVLHSSVWGCSGGGKAVPEFTKRFTAFQEAKYGVCVVNGTAALEVALKAVGVKAGDEVIVPPYTFIASASSIILVNAIPVFVDIDPDTYCIDPAKIEAAITDKTKAIMAVHIAGCPADMDAICAIAKKHNLKVIEDAAQAHGAAWNGRRVGAIGDIGTFSFQASKNLNAGEGGIVVSNDKEIGDRAWSLANVGRIPTGAWYEHRILGWNLRLTEFQAAILLKQMDRLEEQMAKREENARYLDKLLSEIPGIRPLKRDPRVTSHANHLYIFRYNSDTFCGVSRDRFLQALTAEGIPCYKGYVPLYREQAFAVNPDGCPLACRFAGRKMDYRKVICPVCEKASDEEAVWLTQNLLLGTTKDMDDIAAAIRKIHSNAGEMVENS